MDWMWWVSFGVIVAFLLMIIYALACASEPISPEEEARLIREQAEERERRRKKKWSK